MLLFISRLHQNRFLPGKIKRQQISSFFRKSQIRFPHYRRLLNITDVVTAFASSVLNFDEKLGMVFLQHHDNFKPKDYDRLETFVKDWPKEVPLAIELRNEEWFSDEEVYNTTMDLFEKYSITNIIVDTAGRRDLLHMRLTTDTAFIRYVGANAESDYTRLDDWIERLKIWKKEGLKNLYVFVHQNIEKASPLLSAYFIGAINKEFDINIHVPVMAEVKTKF